MAEHADTLPDRARVSPHATEDARALLQRAEAALLEAKDTGRNRVVAR